MEYYIAIFWSRAEALSFSNSLKMRGIPSAVIPTPKEAGRTCGLSVKILPDYLSQAKDILRRSRNSSFGGWLKFSNVNGRNVIVRM